MQMYFRQVSSEDSDWTVTEKTKAALDFADISRFLPLSCPAGTGGWGLVIGLIRVLYLRGFYTKVHLFLGKYFQEISRTGLRVCCDW